MTWPASPPNWILAIIIAVATTILAAHLLNTAYKIATKITRRRRGQPAGDPLDVLIPTLEFFVVVVIAGLAAHSLLHSHIRSGGGGNGTMRAAEPLILVAALVYFALQSMRIIKADKRSGSGQDPADDK